MTYSFLSSSRSLAIVLAASAIGASLYSTRMGSGASPLYHHARMKQLQSWTYVKVDNPNANGCGTQVTGINNLAGSNGPQIVGNYISNCGTTTAYTYYNSFYASGPSFTNFTDASYPSPVPSPTGTQLQGTQMNAINTQANAAELPVLAGIAYDPGAQAGTWAVVDNQGLWSLIKNPGSDGGTANYDGYLYGINDNDVVVGYHTTTTHPSPLAYDVSPPENSTDVPFKWSVSTSIAYGINDSDDMVGILTMSGSSSSESWYALCKSKSCPSSNSSAYCFNILQNSPNTNTTVAYAISQPIISSGISIRQIVGSYTDANGTHGFIVPVTQNSSGQCSQGTIETIDEPNTNTLTVVHGINNEGYIAGWYKAANSLHGFVGIPKAMGKRRRTRR